MRRRRYNPNWNAARAGGEALDQLQELLAVLRASYLTTRTAHWQARGDAYYGDHLMLQRIYEETEKHIDAVGERIVGYFGVSAVDLADQTERVAAWSADLGHESDPLQASLRAAETVRDVIEKTYDVVKGVGAMRLGLDDLLMSTANDQDTHVYLLQQALDGRQTKVRQARAANPSTTFCDPEQAWRTDQENLRRMAAGLPVTFAPGSAHLLDCSHQQVVAYYRDHPQMLSPGDTPERVAMRVTKGRLSR